MQREVERRVVDESGDLLSAFHSSSVTQQRAACRAKHQIKRKRKKEISRNLVVKAAVRSGAWELVGQPTTTTTTRYVCDKQARQQTARGSDPLNSAPNKLVADDVTPSSSRASSGYPRYLNISLYCYRRPHPAKRFLPKGRCDVTGGSEPPAPLTEDQMATRSSSAGQTLIPTDTATAPDHVAPSTSSTHGGSGSLWTAE
ncbi:hypothetical protein C0Q70_08695 [Pomacea canaliculata]|uniref:Uncharacterized protein n=1 Tax=Pomacea canaliculata TaxID=400727 RepID=A0A2T7P7P4_POMCA|nr:hypothetical protein C0Q70_08695 [Pomacea canaliculata]